MAFPDDFDIEADSQDYAFISSQCGCTTDNGDT